MYDIDRYVKDEYYNLAYPRDEFKLVGYEVDTIDSYKKRIYELEVENSKLKEKLDLERDVIREELNRCRLSNRNGRNDDVIRRLSNVMREITELTGVKYERWDIMATTKTG